MALHDIVKPQWVRLTDPNNGYVGSLDPQRGILMTVRRGGTAYFDLAEIIAEWHRKQTETEVKGE